ncbi:MAG: hypothetical protein ABI068_09385 [Ktedonobacterales bacterium]
MSARHLPHSLISQTDLCNCTGPAEVFDLLRTLRYPVEQRPTLTPLEPGDLPETLRLVHYWECQECVRR